MRWFGDGLEVPTHALRGRDLEHLQLLYGALTACYETWLEGRPGPDWSALADQIRAFGEPPLRTALEALGEATLAEAHVPPLLRRAVHDLRGGAFFALRLYGVLLADEEPSEELVQPAVLLARDQAKLVRSLVPSIDPEGYRKDREERAHGMRELVDKWSGFHFPPLESGDGVEPVVVEVTTRWRGELAARCLEASALDRVIYNLVNNAARFTTDGRVRLLVEAVSHATVRIAVRNALAPDDADWIASESKGETAALFLGGSTRGGTGLGLQSSAVVVARAWGQVTPEEAVDTGVVGARVRDGVFTSWFFWPAYLVDGRGLPPTLEAS
jgi:signal transduction histidine kinase